ncbi:hypothetical protein G6L37_06975 [Agrobacterium rubi]|nr:hypothetical protein [Agrobacterium rubi]NTF25108.1 hypothetical protein [Agrobacterium rubi]
MPSKIIAPKAPARLTPEDVAKALGATSAVKTKSRSSSLGIWIRMKASATRRRSCQFPGGNPSTREFQSSHWPSSAA